MSVPDDVRKHLKAVLWAQANSMGWLHLSASAKSQQYENWAKDEQVGGVLERFVDQRRIRAYLKDTLLKRYSAEQKSGTERPMRVLGISTATEIAETYVKPHGRRLADGRIISWGKAREWKMILMALHERAYTAHAEAFGAVLFEATGRYGERNARSLVEDAAKKLGVGTVVWLEM
jgi:hypothetical protein